MASSPCSTRRLFGYPAQGYGECLQTNRADKIFVLSLKAAGTGLNLTAANHVIHYDLWWNPAVEAQATDRAYRIGQKSNVMVHRFITKGTFEERINEMIQGKKSPGRSYRSNGGELDRQPQQQGTQGHVRTGRRLKCRLY